MLRELLGHRCWIRRLALGSAILVCLLSSGCSNNHQDWMDAANSRWAVLRSSILLPAAENAFETGSLEQANQTLAEALSVDPKNAKLHVLSGRIALERGELERAHQWFENARTFDTENAAGHYYQGIVLQRWQRHGLARDCYQQALDLVSDNVYYLLAVAEMHVALNDVDQAVELLESKLVIFDQNAGIRLALGQLYAMKQQYEHAADCYHDAALLQPDDLQILEDLAQIRLTGGQYEEAARDLERLINEPTHADRLNLRRQLATCYLKLGQNAQARQTLIEVTRKDRKDADSWVRLSEMAWAEQDVSSTLVAANRAIALAPRQHKGYLLAGMVWHKRQHFDQAVRMFDQAAELAPDNSLPLVLRGMALEEDGKVDEAVRSYQQALNRQPNDQRALRLLAQLSQGS